MQVLSNNKGVALVTVIIIVSVITVLIVSLNINTITSFFTSNYYRSSEQNFFMCEGANKIEESEVVIIGVSDISQPSTIKDEDVYFPGSSEKYHSKIKYEFYNTAIIPGTSLNMFNNYYYTVETTKDDATIRELISKLGPRM